MAVFDPEVPNPNPPNYLGYSRAYEGISPTAVAIKGAADVIDNAVKGADTVVKTVIDQGIQKDVDAVRGDFTAKLEDAAGVPPHMRVGTPLNILPTATGENAPPPQISEGLDSSAGVVAAGGKVKPWLNTYYTAQLDKIAKDYRSRFPGYVDHIDRKFESYTGMNPANRIISDLIGVIQAGSDGDKSNLHKAQTLLEKYLGQEGEINGEKITAAQMMQIINSGRVADPLSYVTAWSAKIDRLRAEQKSILDNAAVSNAASGVNKDASQKALVDLARSESSIIWTNVLGKIPGMTTAQLHDFISRAQRGEEVPFDSKTWDVLSTAMDEELRQARLNIRTKASVRDDRGNSIWVHAGTDAEKYIDHGLQDIIDVRDALRSKDGSLIGRTARYMTLKLNDSRYGLINDPKIGAKFLELDAVQHFGGPAVSGALSAQILGNHLPSDVHTYFDQVRTQMMIPSEKGGVPYTFLDVIKDAKAKKLGVQLPPNDPSYRPNAKQDREFYDQFLQFPGKVLNNDNTSIPLKLEVAGKVFSQRTLGMIGEFEAGPDQVAAWNYLTNKEKVVKPLKQISSNDPYVWPNAKSWADQEFRRFLFTNEVNNLRTMSTQPGIGIGYRPGDAEKAPEFYAYPKEVLGGPEGEAFTAAARRNAQGVSNTYFKRVDESLKRLNAGIKGVSNFIQEDKGDPNVYVLKTMIDAGFDPKTTVGIPGEMIKALTSPVKEVDPFKTKKKKDTSKPYNE